MRILLLILITGLCFADDKIAFLNKETFEVTDICVDNVEQRKIYEKVILRPENANKEIIFITDSPVLQERKPLILKDEVIQIDEEKTAEIIAKESEAKAIQEKLITMAKAEIAKEAVAIEVKPIEETPIAEEIIKQ